MCGIWSRLRVNEVLSPTTQEVCGEMMRKMTDEFITNRTRRDLNPLHTWRSALMVVPGQRARGKPCHRDITWHFHTFPYPNPAGSPYLPGKHNWAGRQPVPGRAQHHYSNASARGRLLRGSGDNGAAGLIKLAWHSQPERGGGELSLSVFPILP